MVASSCWRCVVISALLTAATIGHGASFHSEVLDQHPRIYVAPLPAIFNYRVLTDYDVKRFFHQFGTDPQALISQPIGAIENYIEGMEVRNTYMYGLDIIFHTHLLQSPLRVHSQEEADIIYLPFYAALECRLSQAMEGTAHKEAYAKRVEKFWEDFEKDFPYYKTKPHVIVIGRREAELMGSCGVGDAMYGKVKACTLLCNKLAEHIHVMTVEVWTGSLETMQKDRHRKHSVSVPWPGHYHISAGSEYHHRHLDSQQLAAAKLTVAMESLRVRFPLRKQLSEQCAAKGPPGCVHYNPRGNIGQMNQSAIYQATHGAWFCLQPFGDGPSRHVTMDCMAADTIPVFFDKYLAQHSSFADVVDYSEFTAVVDPADLNSTNIVDILQERFPMSKRTDMVARLHKVKHIFLYSVNPLHTLVRFDEMSVIHPLDDAFTASLKALLRHACASGTLPAGRCSGTSGPPTAAPSSSSSSSTDPGRGIATSSGSDQTSGDSSGGSSSEAGRRVAPGYDAATWRDPNADEQKDKANDSGSANKATATQSASGSSQSQSLADKRTWNSKAGRWE